MGDILSIILLILLAILLVGPRKLPAGIEALWLTWTNFSRSQHGGDPLSLDTARLKWQSEKNPFFNGIQLLYAASEHLAELRQRLFVALLAFGICVAITFVFSNQIFAILLAPLEKIPVPPPPPTTTIFTLTDNVPVSATVSIPGTENAVSVTVNLPAGTQLPVTYIQVKPLTVYFTKPTEMFVTTFKVDLFAAAGLTLPVVLYEIVAFLLPGLLPNEKKYVFILMPSIAFFFVLGVVFAYFLMLPFATNFLFTFGSDIAQPLPSINEYISFVVSVLFLVGFTFETPLVIFFLAKLKIVDIPKLKSARRFAIVGAFIIAALVTPTPDPINQAIVAIPIILLYELGIILARFA
jgi:sec-independent protein translocase protein TatC